MHELGASEALHVQADKDQAGGGTTWGHQGEPPASPPGAAATWVQRRARGGEPVGEPELEEELLEEEQSMGEAVEAVPIQKAEGG